VTLLEEIADTAASTGSREDVREEVRAHLLKMCSIRRGALLLAPDYGLDDPSHLFHSYPGGLDEWLAQLAHAVQLYEPRLADVQVRSLPTEDLDFTLRFEIRGTLTLRDRSDRTKFTASIDPLQRWSVR
jgi:type VI secretion system protein